MISATADAQEIGSSSAARWRRIGLVGILILAIAMPLLYLRLIARDFPLSRNDLIAVWVGIRNSLHGVDPYGDGATHAIQRMYYGRELAATDDVNKMGFAYPAYVALVLAPLGWLPLSVAKIVLLLAAGIAMAASAPLWLQAMGVRRSRDWMIVSVVLTLSSWPMVWAFRLCQATLVVAATLAIGCALLKRGRDGWAGAVLALGLIKPQLAGLTLAWLILWAILRRRWSFVWGVLGVTAMLFSGSEALLPGWIPRWLAAMADYSLYIHAKPGLELQFSMWVAVPALVLLGGLGAWQLWRSRGCALDTPEFGLAIGLTLALTVSLMPTTLPMVYNQILLLPAVLGLVCAVPSSGYTEMARRAALLLVWVSYLLVPIAVVGILLRGVSEFWETVPFFDLVLPVIVAVALIARMGWGDEFAEAH